MQNTFRVSLQSKEKVARSTYRFLFQRPKRFPDFFPGQYIWINISPSSVSTAENTRFFTIASSPLNKENIMIITKRGKSAFKKMLFALPINGKITVGRPAGGFVLKEKEKSLQVFISAGVGITPFYSMLMYIKEKKLSLPIILFACFLQEEEIICYKELMLVQQQCPFIRVVFVLAQLTPIASLSHREKGYISGKIIRKYIPANSSALYYIVGSPKMVTETEKLLYTKLAIPLSHIRMEQFEGYTTK